MAYNQSTCFFSKNCCIKSYSFAGEYTLESLIVYYTVRSIIEAPNPHSFAMECVKIHRFKTVQAETFALKKICRFFLRYKVCFVKIFQ